MEELKGTHCGICGKAFEEKDENGDGIVYCPVCGAPAHRSCWEKKGGCPFEDKHGEGFVYPQGDESSAAPHNDTENGSRRSPALYEQEQGEKGGSDRQQREDEDEDDITGRLIRLLESRNGEKSGREKTEEDYGEKKYDGVSEREMMCFMNVDGPQRLYRLSLMKYMITTNRKVSINIFAGLLNPYNQFYKGMTSLGLLLTLFNYIMGLPQIIAYYLTFFKDKTAEAVTAAIDEAALVSVSNTMWIIQLTVISLLCIFGDYLYVSFMIRKIKKIRSQYENEQSEEYLVALAEAGRPRLGLVALGFVLQAFLSLLTLWLFANSGI